MPTRHPVHPQLRARWAALLALSFLSLFARAEQSRPVPIEDLARRAEAVVHGRVSSLECRRDAAGHVYTQVELEVTASWKGAATNRFVVTLAGGILGSRKVVVVGQPEFQVGEEVVVFASRNERGESLLLELGQGKFAVKREPASGKSSVSNGVFGAAATDPGKAGYRLPSQLPLTLEQLKERVQAATAEPPETHS